MWIGDWRQAAKSLFFSFCIVPQDDCMSIRRSSRGCAPPDPLRHFPLRAAENQADLAGKFQYLRPARRSSKNISSYEWIWPQS